MPLMACIANPLVRYVSNDPALRFSSGMIRSINMAERAAGLHIILEGLGNISTEHDRRSNRIHSAAESTQRLSCSGHLLEM